MGKQWYQRRVRGDEKMYQNVVNTGLPSSWRRIGREEQRDGFNTNWSRENDYPIRHYGTPVGHFSPAEPDIVSYSPLSLSIPSDSFYYPLESEQSSPNVVRQGELNTSLISRTNPIMARSRNLLSQSYQSSQNYQSPPMGRRDSPPLPPLRTPFSPETKDTIMSRENTGQSLKPKFSLDFSSTSYKSYLSFPEYQNRQSTGKLRLALEKPLIIRYGPSCIKCGAEFQIFKLKHVCRCCGREFCWSCSRHTASVVTLRQSNQRVCDFCFYHLSSGKEFCLSRLVPHLQHSQDSEEVLSEIASLLSTEDYVTRIHEIKLLPVLWNIIETSEQSNAQVQVLDILSLILYQCGQYLATGHVPTSTLAIPIPIPNAGTTPISITTTINASSTTRTLR
eukprot:TRINITY_DN5830_c0_g1_i6.p1 TRINITY_DN5830_c0_g1~~TRINITY_DN5830_c0_g1_i6.p1  ORF type:complete len:392 (-),score=47.85 TRINITY_DN5830_c0_g1_i6:7-1182(-)